MRTISSPEQHGHNPPSEFIDGQLKPYLETPRRVEIIEAALAVAEMPAPEAPRDFGLAPILAVHSAEYVAYLEHAYARWLEAGLPAAGVMPSTVAVRGMRAGSSHPQAQAGLFCFDLSAPIVAGTYLAARGSANAALGGAALLLAGERAAYALCRPPGHHAAHDLAGGYCFLNNAAIAAHLLATANEEASDNGVALELGDEPLGGGLWSMRPPTVAVLDIDFHHGNGTQAIFYDRSDVFFVSLHGDPDREYPFFLGFADERGAGAGEGYNLNLPLEKGVDDARYLAVLENALEAITAYSPRYLVVSAGFDTFGGDPLGDFQLTTGAFAHIGARIAQLGLPTLFVQEGGYAIEALGQNVVSLLMGFEEG